MAGHIKRVALSCVALFFILNESQAQDKIKADSLIQVLNTQVIPDSSRLILLDDITFYSPSPDDKIEYASRLVDLSEKIGELRFLSLGYLQLGVAYSLNGDLEQSLQYLFESAKIAEANNFDTLLAETYSEIGITYSKNDDIKNSLIYKSKAIEILRNLGNQQTLAINLLNTGYSYYTINNLDTALAYYNEAEPIFNEIGLDIGTAYTIGNRALVFWKQADSNRAIEDLLVAIKMLEPLGDQYGMADYYNQLGNIYLEQNQQDEAIKHTAVGLEMAKAEDLKEQVRDASLQLSKLYEQKQDYRQALEYQTQYIAYKDSIQDDQTIRRLADLRTEFEVGQKQAEVDLANQQKKNRQNLSITLSAVLLLTAVYLGAVYRSSRKRKRLNEELQSLNATKDKFFSIISHDLRGPVSAFNGIGRMIKMLLNSKSYDELDEMTGYIDDSAKSLSDLLDNLLNWAVQQQGQVPYQPEILDLSKIAADNVNIFDSSAQAKEITLTNHIIEPLEVHADRNTTMTILRNLIGNAMKFTSKGGSIDIVAEIENNRVKVSVKDTGVGMSQEVLDKLFVLADKKSTYGTSGEKGLGLGLQLVQEFVYMNQGEIQVASKEGEGSTFTFWLPCSV